jgi:hypothetical protein
VKSIRSYQMRSFEVMLACASNGRGGQQLFSNVPVEAIDSVCSSAPSCASSEQRPRRRGRVLSDRLQSACLGRGPDWWIQACHRQRPSVSYRGGQTSRSRDRGPCSEPNERSGTPVIRPCFLTIHGKRRIPPRSIVRATRWPGRLFITFHFFDEARTLSIGDFS